MSTCENEQMWRWEDVKMWRWADVKMSRCEDEKVWRWADVKMRRCEDEKMWRWADVKMRRCEGEKMWRWADVKMRRCEDEQMWRWEGVKMRRCEDEKVWEKVWRWEDEKMRRWDTDPHYWKNPALRRSREKHNPGPKSWETWTCKFKKSNSEVLQSRWKQCRNEAFEWTVVCSRGEEESVYVLKWIGEIFMLNESCWFWTGGVSFLLVKLERKHTRRFALLEPVFLHFTCRLMHPFGEILSPFGMDIYLFWIVMVPFFD